MSSVLASGGGTRRRYITVTATYRIDDGLGWCDLRNVVRERIEQAGDIEVVDWAVIAERVSA